PLLELFNLMLMAFPTSHYQDGASQSAYRSASNKMEPDTNQKTNSWLLRKYRFFSHLQIQTLQ
ncbi:MAG: hypothetical protein ACREPR_22785, partial [Brasilonema sp.]